MPKPIYVVVEGLDGAGKTSLIKCIAKLLGENVRVVREPGGTPLAEEIREITKRTNFTEFVNDGTDQLLMAASRSQSLSEVVAPALRDGCNVIGDRCYWSTLAYNCRTQESYNQYWNLHQVYGKPFADPDLYVYVDVDPAIGLARVSGRGGPDRYEARGLDYFRQVRSRYGKIVLATTTPVIVIDGTRPLIESFTKLERVLPDFLARLDGDNPIRLTNEDRTIIEKIPAVADNW